MRLAASILLLILCAASFVGATPLVIDPQDQVEPDIYGRWVVYRDYQSAGEMGSDVVAYDLTTGSKTTLNNCSCADNRPAVGGNRAVWCDRRWDDGFGIVSTVMGSGHEDVIVQEGASAWGVDVNNHWAMWYHFGENEDSDIRVYSFATSQIITLEATRDASGYYDKDAHMDHTSDSILIRAEDGSYISVDIATGTVSTSSAADYDSSRHGHYGGAYVWDELGADSYSGRNIYISNAPEPSGLAALFLGAVGMLIRCRGVLSRSERRTRLDSESSKL
jgi:hypothetical protein